MLSYANIKQAKADRDVLQIFLRALDAPRGSLRRDECGSWYIKGHKGHVYTSAPSGGWLIFCDGQSPRKWSAIKRRLCFCKLMQNGDTEGCLGLLELPTREQAVAIRKALGLKRTRAANAGSFAGINLASANRGVSGAPVSGKEKGGVITHPETSAQNLRQNLFYNEPEVAQSTFRSRAR